MICPLLKAECPKKECGWFVKELEECAVVAIPGTIMSLSSIDCENCDNREGFDFDTKDDDFPENLN